MLEREFKWAGVTERHRLEVAQDVCRLEMRVKEFGGSESFVIKACPQSSLGLLIRRIHKVLKNIGVEYLPTQEMLGRAVGIKKSQFHMFFSGKIHDEPKSWQEVARRCLWFLLAGTLEPKKDDDSNHPVSDDSVLIDIDRYFFRRKWNDTPFFDKNRIESSEPMTLRELVGEVQWLSREPRRKPAIAKDCKLIYVSGGPDFFPQTNSGNDFIESVKKCSSAGINVRLIHSSNQTLDAITDDELKEFLILAASRTEASFCNPAIRFLYLYAENKVNLWMVRLKSDDLSFKGERSIANACNRSEIDLFETWLKTTQAADSFTRSGSIQTFAGDKQAETGTEPELK